MTKQQKTYFLLIVVLLIWGVIGYQIFSKLNTNQETTATVEMPKKYIPKKIKKDKPYTIKADYRDPFLGKFPSKKIVRKKIIKKTMILFPSIIYNGVIAGNTSQSYILTINGNQEVFKLKETINEVKLLKVTKEEVMITYKGNKKIIRLQE